MRKRIFLSVIAVAFFALAGFNAGKLGGVKTILTENADALAEFTKPPLVNYICIGTGDITCPLNGKLINIIIETPYRLPIDPEEDPEVVEDESESEKEEGKND